MNNTNNNTTKRCNHCGKFYPEHLISDVYGQPVCKDCVEESLRRNVPKPSRHTEGPMPSHYEVPRTVRNKAPNAFFLFCLSIMPGLNYMYLGLMKKGVFVLASFFLSIALTGTFNSSIFGMVTFIILAISFFDGFKNRREIIQGKPVNDSFDDIMFTIDKYKNTILVVFIIIAGLELLNTLKYSLYSLPSFIRNLGPLIPIGIILLVIFISKGRKKSYTEDKNQDINKEQ